MPEELPPEATTPVGVQPSLHAVAEILRDPHPLSLEVRRALADFVDELGTALAGSAVPPAEVTHLADSAAHLVKAVNRRDAPGMLAAARNRLEAAVLATESKAPLTAGLAQRLLDALANIGI
jgi:hypothetical protein